MFVLSKIFGDCPQVKMLEVFADHFDEELSIPDIIWLTDIPKSTIYDYVRELVDEKILLEGKKIGKTQLYHLNNKKEEVKIIITLVNYIVSEKLAEKLEEKGLKRLEESEIVNMDKKTPFESLFMASKNYSKKIVGLLNPTDYNQTKKVTSTKYRNVCI